ncbi:hypothetical protein Tco_0902486 [Tanacetum coccineum]
MVDTYSENLKGELSFVKAENAKLSDEVENLMKMLNLEDSIRLQSNLEGLISSLEFSQSQEVDLETKKADARLECSSMVEHQPDSDGAHGGCKFKNLELNSLIEKKQDILKTLENLEYTFRSYKAASKLRLSIKYEDGDEMIVAHMVDEVDAFNKEVTIFKRFKSIFKGEVVVKSEVEVKSEDDKSSEDDKCSEDSSEELIKFLSRRNLQWQFLKQSHEEEPKPVPSNTEEEDLLPLDIVYPVEEIASSSRGTCRRGVPHASGSRGNRGRGEPLASSSRGNRGRGETRYALRSLGHI